MLAIGSTLIVVACCLAGAIVAEAGATLVIVNRAPSAAYDMAANPAVVVT